MSGTTTRHKGEDSRGTLLTVAIVLGHAIKHVYISGFQTIVFPEMKIALGLSNTSFGALATARQATSGVTTLAPVIWATVSASRPDYSLPYR